MNNIGINAPCSENWEGMTSTEKGAFCQRCATEVHDFTNKSNQEIKSTLKRLIGQPVCGRISPEQENALNLEFEEWNLNSKRELQSTLIFSLIVVFGLALFSCSNEKEKETIVQIQRTALSSVGDVNTRTQKILISEENKLVSSLVEIKRQSLAQDRDYQRLYSCALNKQLDEAVKLEQMEFILSEVNQDIYLTGAMVISQEYQHFLIQNDAKIDPLIEIERDVNGIEIPAEFSSKIYPNPVSTIATLQLSLPYNDKMAIDLFDLNGKHIHSIHSGEVERGTFNFQIDMTNQYTGMYVIVIRSMGYNETIRLNKL